MSSQSIAISNLAEKLRCDNYHQFNVLVRMHLSFVLDFHTTDGLISEKNKLKKWPFYKKSKHNSKAIVDGALTTQEGISQVYQLIEFLKKEQNITCVGIFRRTGSLTRQQALKNLLIQGSELCLENSKFSVHDCASVLKGFLAELSEPLLTDAHFPAYCQLAELFGTTRRPMQEVRLLRTLQLLLLLLPLENRELLRNLLDLLHLTAFFENHNKMCADSLATLFTPHLLCPLDIKAYYTEKEKTKLQSLRWEVNESICDTAKTVYSFVDHEKTTKENQSNPTETALAQLYAHIQSLPESSKKRKLIKQFNKENGQGIPLQVLRCVTGISPGEKTVGSSLKKIRSFAKTMKTNRFGSQRSFSDEFLSSVSNVPRLRLFCANCDENSDGTTSEKNNLVTHICNSCDSCFITDDVSPISEKRSKSDLNLSSSIDCITSTPVSYFQQRPYLENVTGTFTPTDDRESLSDSPITRSTHRMSKTMQETMMTPRSRKPLLLVSGTNLTNFPKLKTCENMNSLDEVSKSEMKNKISLRRSRSVSSLNSAKDEKELSSLSKTFINYTNKGSIILASSSEVMFVDVNDLSPNEMGSPLSDCLNGKKVQESFNHYEKEDVKYQKQLVLQSQRYDENGKPTVYETSF
ncbi:rho GTPase-activating protein 19-like isoform X2 [Agrilus planipennis]|uniref:Rho GTPase-activating protein 19-like isoform X2 n=1 Tax=Agrilus planipennis TaxID=224129 RepID=A0A1W4WRS4_AGRPL|nr:rho GTPase-activating protein 19-like isoform X2 [Agrilus planipennis]